MDLLLNGPLPGFNDDAPPGAVWNGSMVVPFDNPDFLNELPTYFQWVVEGGCMLGGEIVLFNLDFPPPGTPFRNIFTNIGNGLGTIFFTGNNNDGGPAPSSFVFCNQFSRIIGCDPFHAQHLLFFGEGPDAIFGAPPEAQRSDWYLVDITKP